MTTTFFIIFILVSHVHASEQNLSQDVPVITHPNEEVKFSDQTIKAEVLEVIEEKDIFDENGKKQTLQKIKLNEINGSSDEFVYDGISQNSTTKKTYHKGDKVLVNKSKYGSDESILITDSIRTLPLWFYITLFIIVTVWIARWKGLKALFSLALTIGIVLWAIIPLIAKGMNPLIVVIIFSIPILASAIYLTHGFNKESHVALAGTFAGVAMVGILSLIFAKISNLSGFADEEVVYIGGLLKDNFNPYSLLLAGFVIGALGVVDDVALTQVSAVSEIKKANPNLSSKDIYKRAMTVGVDHVSSVINTLFLAYAGASFALLLLFNYRQPPFESTFLVLNNEIVVTEIVRTIVGSIGVLLVIPLTTFLASKIDTK